MWSSEVERIGFRRCTPVGYVASALCGLFFLASVLLAVGMILFQLALYTEIRWVGLLWALPLFVLGVVCKVTGDTLGRMSQFEYDYEANEARWDDGGPQRYAHAEWEAEVGSGG